MPEAEKQLSPALENYLAIIFRQEFAAGACRPSDIADAAGVARPSVTNALREEHATKQHAASPKAPPAIVHRNEFVKD